MRPPFDAGRRRTVLAAGLSALPPAGWLALPRAARAAGFPDRAVRIVVPYSVGVGPDVVARALADRLQQQWQQPVVVDNKPGASGIVAFGDVRRTAPDGHTLYLADTATLAVNPLIHAQLPYDPARDLVPLTLLFRATFVLWIASHNRLRTLAELVDAARRQPNSVSYASLGNGHASQVAIEIFARAAGIRMLHVPFKDAGALISAVVAGDVDITAFSVNTVAGLVKGGKLRGLAVGARQPLPGYPDIPTIAQAGGPPVEMHPWAALVTVAGTPQPVQDQLQRDLVAAMGSPDVRSRADQAGFEITPSTPRALRERIDADVALYAPLVAEGRVARL